MKISLALGERKPLDRTTAWGCLTANLAVPGCGSLVAGRVSGYFQLLLAVAGLAMTLFFGLKLFAWYVNGRSQMQNMEGDMAANLEALWLHLRWVLFGIMVFLAGLLWALASSVGILFESRKSEPSAPPLLSEAKR